MPPMCDHRKERPVVSTPRASKLPTPQPGATVVSYQAPLTGAFDAWTDLKGSLRAVTFAFLAYATDLILKLLFGDVPLVDFVFAATAKLLLGFVFLLHALRALSHLVQDFVLCAVTIVASAHRLKKALRHPSSIDRGSCPCNSGESFKNCHGKQ
jgi:hypothetical protein